MARRGRCTARPLWRGRAQPRPFESRLGVARGDRARGGRSVVHQRHRCRLADEVVHHFSSDERALESMLRRRDHISVVLKRVAKHDEWGVRVVLDRARAIADRSSSRKSGSQRISGAGYLAKKKTQRDAKAELVERSREVVGDLFDRLARQSGFAKRRAPLGNCPHTERTAAARCRVPGPAHARDAVSRHRRAPGPESQTKGLSGLAERAVAAIQLRSGLIRRWLEPVPHWPTLRSMLQKRVCSTSWITS